MTALYENTCPVCGQGPRKRCRTLKTGRVTDTHMARIDDWQNPPPRAPATLSLDISDRWYPR